MNYDVLLGVLTVVSLYGIRSFFADRAANRVHENKLSNEALVAATELNKTVLALDEHTRKDLSNFKVTLVEVLKDMREIVKNTESERNRVGAVAAATLLRPGNRKPAP